MKGSENEGQMAATRRATCVIPFAGQPMPRIGDVSSSRPVGQRNAGSGVWSRSEPFTLHS